MTHFLAVAASANNPACPQAGSVKAGGGGPKKTAYRGQGDGKAKAVQMKGVTEPWFLALHKEAESLHKGQGQLEKLPEGRGHPISFPPEMLGDRSSYWQQTPCCVSQCYDTSVPSWSLFSGDKNLDNFSILKLPSASLQAA